MKEFKGEIPRPHKFTLKKLVIKGVPKISGKQFITIEIDNKVTPHPLLSDELFLVN